MINLSLRVVCFLMTCCSIVCANENSADNEAAMLNFLINNRTEATGMVKSFHIPQGYWETVDSKKDNIENRNERILATFGQNIYDGATWQIALALMGEAHLAAEQTNRLLSNRSGDFKSLRATASEFKYGDEQQAKTHADALFFRMISDSYLNDDPLTNEAVEWMDWKPILGENAWAAMIGPLQVAHAKYRGNIPLDCKEVRLALSILPTIEAMQSPIGGIYHSPWGVSGKNPHDISAENNASLLAGLKMLQEILQKKNDPDGLVPRLNNLIQGIENYFKDYAFDSALCIFGQGGVYDDPSNPGRYSPTPDFAVDVQTWGITVLGAKKVDEWLGPNKAYEIWQNTKAKGGFFENGVLKGVGYTDDPNSIISVEWTLGAILLVNELYDYYHFPDLLEDAKSMREGIESLKDTVILNGEKTVAYRYASKRYYIPFGWWANDFSSTTSTAWVLMVDRGFNPFILGGK